MFLCVNTCPPTDVCSGSAGEESVETLSEQLELSEFIIKPGAGNSSSIRPLLIMCVSLSLCQVPLYSCRATYTGCWNWPSSWSQPYHLQIPLL